MTQCSLDRYQHYQGFYCLTLAVEVERAMLVLSATVQSIRPCYDSGSQLLESYHRGSGSITSHSTWGLGGQSGTGTGFCPRTLVLSCHSRLTNAPYLFIYHSCCIILVTEGIIRKHSKKLTKSCTRRQ
jgi:hypothetical protein